MNWYSHYWVSEVYELVLSLLSIWSLWTGTLTIEYLKSMNWYSHYWVSEVYHNCHRTSLQFMCAGFVSTSYFNNCTLFGFSAYSNPIPDCISEQHHIQQTQLTFIHSFIRWFFLKSFIQDMEIVIMITMKKHNKHREYNTNNCMYISTTCTVPTASVFASGKQLYLVPFSTYLHKYEGFDKLHWKCLYRYFSLITW